MVQVREASDRGAEVLSLRIPLRDRWRRARRDTHGIRAWKREVGVSLLVGTLTYMILLRYGSAQSARDQLIVVVVAMLVTAVLLPAAEFSWNFNAAPFRIAVDEVRRLAKEKEVLQRQLDAATGWKGIASTRLREFWDRGAELRRAILGDSNESESANQRWWSEFIKWRQETLDYLHSISPSKAAYVDEVKIVGTPISHGGKPLVKWKEDIIKQIDSRLERVRLVMQDYPGAGRLDSD